MYSNIISHNIIYYDHMIYDNMIQTRKGERRRPGLPGLPHCLAERQRDARAAPRAALGSITLCLSLSLYLSIYIYTCMYV